MSLEASTSKVEDGPARAPRRMTEYLDNNYMIKASKEIYVASLRNWLIFIYGKDSVGNYLGMQYGFDQRITKRNIEKRLNKIEEGIERYFSELDDRDFLDDYKGFIRWMRNEEYANLSISTMCNKVKLFFGRNDPRCKISDEDFAQIRRTLLPKSSRASTQDDILTKEELKSVLGQISVHGKALALFLLSSGARIGESCQLKMEDIHLNDDPPWVNIKEKYTKGEVGGRLMWFSYEARDAIIAWHKYRKGRMKSGGFGSYLIGPEAGSKDLVFNYSPNIFGGYWNKCLAKADGGQIPPVLARRDTSTKKNIHVFHVHTLRKFFNTNMGVNGSYQGRSGIPEKVIHAWMGHKAYLSEYDRLGVLGMADIYRDNMNVVTVHDVGAKARAEIKELKEDSDKKDRKTMRDEERERARLERHGEQIGAFAGMSEAEIEDLTVKGIWILVESKTNQMLNSQRRNK